MHRVILIFDMNSFFASVELRDPKHHHLVGKPVIIGIIRRRKVVSTATPEAREFGVTKGMATLRAAKLCPVATWLPPRLLVYEEESDEIINLVKTVLARLGFDAVIGTVGLDEAYIDLTPFCQGESADDSLNKAKPIAKILKSEILKQRKLHCKIGIASNMMMAKIATDQKSPDGINIIYDRDWAAILPPLDVKELPEVGEKTEKKLKNAGYNLIRDIQNSPANTDFVAIVKNNLGSILKDFAWGKDNRPVEPDGPAKSIGREETFEYDTDDLNVIVPVLRDFSFDLEARLKKTNMDAYCVKIAFAYDYEKKFHRQKSFPNPVNSAGEILAHGVTLLQAGDILSKKLYLAGISVSNLTARGAKVQPAKTKRAINNQLKELTTTLFDTK